MLNLRQLQCARALAMHRHYGRAADAIGITQSGLSQSIQRLESHFGVQLFTRSRDGITATAFGEVLLAGAAQVLDRVGAMEREIRLLDNLETGTLNVGVDPMLANDLLTPALTALLAKHPKLRFKVATGGTQEMVARLSAREVDLFVGFPENAAADGLDSRRFALPAPTVAGRADHPLLAVSERTLQDFLDYPLIQGPIARWYLDWAEQHIESDEPALDLLRPYFLETAEVSMLINIAIHSDALFAAMPSDVAAGLENGTLTEVVPPDWPVTVPGIIHFPGHQPLMPAAERLIEELMIVVEQKA